jgi:hypothetical protein
VASVDREPHFDVGVAFSWFCSIPYAVSVSVMRAALYELAAATLTAVDRDQLDAVQAERLVGQLVLDAAGPPVDPATREWHRVLVAADLDPDLIDRAHAEVSGLAWQGADATGRHEPVTDRNVDRILEHIEVLGKPAGWASATTYPSLALAVIDSVWSIGVRYAGVLNVLARYRAARAEDDADADDDTPQGLVEVINGVGGPNEFAQLVNNRQRTSSHNGILKAEAVRSAALVLAAADIRTPADVAASTPDSLDELRTGWTAITGQRSGLSWDYFLMLTGGTGVKADRMVRRFVAEALDSDEYRISQTDAHSLVTQAATRLGVDVSQLDYAIWLYQSGNPAV